jgi:hypothetical protein
VTVKHIDWTIHPNPLIRLDGRERPARWVLAQALHRNDLPVRALHHTPITAVDPAGGDEMLIDPASPIEVGTASTPEPVAGSGYAGFTAAQRGLFYDWLLDPTQPAPRGYQHLYLTHLETRLFEPDYARLARSEILRLLAAEGWRQSEGLARVGLLAGWLAQDAAYLDHFMAAAPVTASLLNTGLGWQALLGACLKAPAVLSLQKRWLGAEKSQPQEEEAALLQLNLDSLAVTLGCDPLHYTLDQLIEGQQAADENRADSGQSDEKTGQTLLERWRDPWLPWRTIHRDLRCTLPQPNLRPTLEPLIAELLRDGQRQAALPQPEDLSEETPEDARAEVSSKNWQLVLEFGDSRSQFYEYVLFQAQKQPDYMMIMDETRQIVHRISYQKRHMRQFWRLWDYVQNWSSTKVYLNGQEMEKWKVWPYSQHLR